MCDKLIMHNNQSEEVVHNDDMCNVLSKENERKRKRNDLQNVEQQCHEMDSVDAPESKRIFTKRDILICYSNPTTHTNLILNNPVHVDDEIVKSSDIVINDIPTATCVIIYQDILKHILRYIPPHSVELLAMRLASKIWNEIIKNTYQRDAWRRIDQKDVVRHPHMTDLMDGEFKILPHHPDMKVLLNIAMEFGTIENIIILFRRNERMLKKLKCGYVCNEAITKMSMIACERGDLQILKWLHRSGYLHIESPRIFAAACQNGNLENMKWLMEIGCQNDSISFLRSVKIDNLENVKWLKEIGCAGGDNLMCHAAHIGNLEMMKWLNDNGCYVFRRYLYSDENALHAAIKNGNLENVQWLVLNGCEVRTVSLSQAVETAIIENIRWMVENGASTDSIYIMRRAVENPKFPILNYLLSIGCPMDAETFRDAANTGRLDVMEWLYENGCAWGEGTFTAACKSGNFDIIKWLKENGCPWNVDAFNAVAEGGNLEMMIWMKENGCDWDEDTFIAAVESKSIENVEWMFANGCPHNDSIFKAAVRSGIVEMLNMMKERGLDWYTAQLFDCAAELGHLDVMKWLLQNNCPLDGDVLRTAIAHGNRENVMWLMQNRCPLPLVIY